MSSLLSADLAAACNALGYYDAKSGKYYADSNTLETVKDLIRYLRRDDETHDIRRQLGETAVLQSDLLPLLKSYWEEADLFDVLLRLVVNLTTPALLLWSEQRPTEKTASNYYLQVEGHLQNYKEAFADETVWAVLSKRLSKILELEPAERGDENSLIIERILILIRNILYIPADSMERRPDNDASIHDQVLWALHQSGMLDIILYVTSSPNESAYYLHILEILSYMLREQKASDLAQAALQRSQTEKLRDEAELLDIRHKEINERQKKAKAYSGTRHSRFGGTFVVKSMKSISENELISHKPLAKMESLDFDMFKVKPKTPRNRLPMKAGATERRSAFSVRLFLKEFCVEFLNGAYNTLMYHVKDNLVRAKSQANDESYYLWAVRFFMEFNRCYKFEVKLVSETMSVQTFHFVQQQSENYYDMMATDKKKLRLWSRRLHLAVLAYRELFMTLSAMDRSPDGNVRDSAKVIKSNIFYVLEYREFILTLLVNYDELKMSDIYLKDLLETQHVFLTMLESFIGREGTVMVQGKSRGKKRASKKGPKKSSQPVIRHLDLDAMWDETSPQLSAILEGSREFSSDVVPFDAASDVPIDDQKVDAMKNIQRKLRDGDLETAVGLLRAAREIWPENDSFGSPNMAPEEEFLALRDVFFADLGENTKVVEPTAPEEVSDDEDDDEDEDEKARYQECDFKFDDFTKRLCHPRIVRAASLALKEFKLNSTHTNHCVVKLLHRIAFDSKMSVMVCQLSIFRTFQRIFEVRDLPQYKELVKFATYIVRQFMKIAEINKKVFMEMLFWKSSKECFDVEYGYSEMHGRDAAKKAWSEQQEDEVRRLFMEHQNSGSTDDVVDFVTENLIDQTKSRRQVLKKLKDLMLLIDYKGKKKSGSRPPKHWTTEEEETLQELFEQYRDSDDPLGHIMENLSVPRPKNRVVEKLVVMGLIQDRKEVQKKRAGSGRKSQQPLSDDDISSSDDDDDLSRSSAAPSGTAQKQQKKKKAVNRNFTEKKRPKHVQVPKAKIVQLLLVTVKNNEMREPLEWLKESLGDAIDDYEVGNTEGIPLVPVMDYAETAMENVEFRGLLKALGVCPPFDEQEMYWRIPVALKPDALQEYCHLIDRALDGTLQIEAEESKDDASGQENVESSDDEDVFNKLRAMANTKSPEKATGHAENVILYPVLKPVNLSDDSSSSAIEFSVSEFTLEEDVASDPSNSARPNEREVIPENNVASDDFDALKEAEKEKRQRSLLDSDSDNETPMSKRSRVIIESDDE